MQKGTQSNIMKVEYGECTFNPNRMFEKEKGCDDNLTGCNYDVLGCDDHEPVIKLLWETLSELHPVDELS